MKRNLMTVSVLMIAVLVFVTASPALAGGKPFSMILDWRQVVPEGTGDPNAFGDVSLTVNGGQGELCYQLRAFVFVYGDDITGATINRAPAGENGPQVVDLQPVFDGEFADGCVNIDSSLAKDIQRNYSQYYLLVTDDSHPDGAARAQFAK